MYQKSILENGIRVVTDAMPAVRSATIGIIVDTGQWDQGLQKTGLAHLVEHMMFQGTSSRDSMQIARFMDEAGGSINAFTTRDYTCYCATVLDDYCPFALDLLGDILLNSIFLSEDVEREKRAILREIDTICDMPDKRADILLKRHVWPGHPLGRPVAGQRESVRALTREDVIYYVHTHYLPDRMVVAAAGHIDHRDFVAQVRDAFWRLLGETGPMVKQPLEYCGGITVEQMPVSQVYFSLGIPAPEYTHADRYGMHVLNKILGDGISSRLFRRIREEQGLVYNIGSEYHAYRDGGLLVVEGCTQPEWFQKVLGQTLSVIIRLITGREPVKADELLRSKNQIRGQHLIAAEDPHTRMSRLATQELYFGRQIATDEIVEKIDAVDVDRLEMLARRCLEKHFSEVAMAIVGPEAPNGYERLAQNAMQAHLN